MPALHVDIKVCYWKSSNDIGQKTNIWYLFYEVNTCHGSSLDYRKVSNIRRTKYQNLNDSRLVLQLSVPNPLKPSVKSIMKM